MRSGQCLCGACTYEIDGEPIVVAHCHCLNCQRGSGAGHTTGAMFAEADVRLSGAVSSYAMPSAAGNTVTRLFCGTCGSPMLASNTGMPGFVTVPLGTMQAPDCLEQQVVVFARSRRPWDCMDDRLQTYDAQPDWKPSDGI